jgi:excisionase family DNA binding protein
MPNSEETVALFVRLPVTHGRRLDQAAAALSAAKKDIIAGLVDRYVDPETPEGLDFLRELPVPPGRPRRVVLDLGEEPLPVGQHSFRASEPADVLTAEQAAELLNVNERDVVELAESGELPGRKIGGHWRFARAAVLDWLAGG